MGDNGQRFVKRQRVYGDGFVLDEVGLRQMHALASMAGVVEYEVVLIDGTILERMTLDEVLKLPNGSETAILRIIANGYRGLPPFKAGEGSDADDVAQRRKYENDVALAKSEAPFTEITLYAEPAGLAVGAQRVCFEVELEAAETEQFTARFEQWRKEIRLRTVWSFLVTRDILVLIVLFSLVSVIATITGAAVGLLHKVQGMTLDKDQKVMLLLPGFLGMFLTSLLVGTGVWIRSRFQTGLFLIQHGIDRAKRQNRKRRVILGVFGTLIVGTVSSFIAGLIFGAF